MNYKKKTKLKSRDCIIKGTNLATGEVEYFLNVASVAKAVGGSQSHAYNVLNKVGYYKSIKGWKLEWIDFDKVSVLYSRTGIKAIDVDYNIKNNNIKA